MAEFEHWDSFYLIVGGAAGALIGLQFVVMTLIADRPIKGVTEVSPAFSTPTIVHFSACLLLAALMRVPWANVAVAARAWGCIGFLGLVYMVIVTKRMLNQRSYKPDLEDWVFFCLTPILGYILLALSTFWAVDDENNTLLAVAAASLCLLFIGIRNSWDSVVFVSTGQQEEGQDP